MFTERSINSGRGAESGLHDRILQAARRRFAREGYAATSIRQIAGEAGATKPMVYYYFGSKEGLLGSVVEAAAAELAAVIEGAVAGDAPARTKLARLLAAHLELRGRDPELLLLLQATLTTAGALPPVAIEPLAGLYERGAGRILDEGVAAGELRTVGRELFVALVRGVALSLGAARTGGPLWAVTAAELSEQTAELLWRGVALSPRQ